MNQVEAESLTLRLMKEHGLDRDGWSFSWSRAKTILGCCSYRAKEIRLSIYLVRSNSIDEVRDTVLHEIAHALVGPGHGHGSVWKAKARALGCRPARCAGQEVDMPDGRYSIICIRCGPIGYRHRLSRQRRADYEAGACQCRKCRSRTYLHDTQLGRHIGAASVDL